MKNNKNNRNRQQYVTIKPQLALSKTYCVYVDWTTEEIARPYYIGKGNSRRVNHISRNDQHTNIRNKYGFTRTVVFETNDENEALLMEVDVIKRFNTFEGWGANLTPGGETSPMKNPETAMKVSTSKKGHVTSKETRAKIGAAVRKHFMENPESRAKCNKSGRKASCETRAKMRQSAKNRKPISETTRERIRQAALNRTTQGFTGKNHSSSAKNLMSEIAREVWKERHDVGWMMLDIDEQ